MKRRPRVYYSLRSPFSWMALRHLRDEVPEVIEAADFVPFWEPDARTAAALTAAGGELHYVEMSKAKHRYILQDTKRQAARFGYTLHWPVDVDPWWELPHLAMLRAEELGVPWECYAAITDARWQHGKNICDATVLRRVFDSAGLDAATLLAAADDARIRDRGVAALLSSYHDDVFGVPYFMVGPHRFWGLDRVDDFIATLRTRGLVQAAQARREPAEQADSVAEQDFLVTTPARMLDTVGAADADTAGGCG